ncbi:hypothetical protein [Rhizobium bangladeshense]|uniref:hypothetical protein n=1 Tax=Rhizobium bangladeshense TaxID=1138189 RepID=UPI000AF21500|nr:hypothetical protein [Rhizobium bangladeshense]
MEGYVAGYGNREKATAIAALIAGPENVQDRMQDGKQLAARGGESRRANQRSVKRIVDIVDAPGA